MKREPDLLRAILLRVEAEESVEAIPGYTESAVLYHLALAIEAGLLSGHVSRGAGGHVIAATPERLTWTGHDFLDAARDEKHWRKALERVARAGGSWSFDLLKQLLLEIAKTALLPLP